MKFNLQVQALYKIMSSSAVHLDRMETAYYAAMLWSSTDKDDDPLDANYRADDISDELEKSSAADCKKFVELAEKAGIDLSQYASDDIGHDLWLTRAGHGAGFWDGDYGEDGEGLTAIVDKSFPNLDPYVGDDGKIYAR